MMHDSNSQGWSCETSNESAQGGCMNDMNHFTTWVYVNDTILTTRMSLCGQCPVHDRPDKMTPQRTKESEPQQLVIMLYLPLETRLWYTNNRCV